MKPCSNECGDHASMKCTDCEDVFCKKCDLFFHKGKRALHIRIPVGQGIEIEPAEVQKQQQKSKSRKNLLAVLKKSKPVKKQNPDNIKSLFTHIRVCLSKP
eukprot:TRINITY_DN2414_c0_g1_i1.p1 TRINITY_DN2414_c0_g1~~TRINITY_DN2414_c0_g1_i1.p1  ORF type:complete len:117 (+),score=16.48 TRINITY_DN2414_c0_g1_i1:50-352(+)